MCILYRQEGNAGYQRDKPSHREYAGTGDLDLHYDLDLALTHPSVV